MSFTRRRFLALAGLAGSAALLQACGGSSSSPAAAPPTSPPAPPQPAASGQQPAAPAQQAPLSQATPAVAQSGSLRKVRYGTTGAGFSPFVALDLGYFAEQGIELDLPRFDSAGNMIGPMGAGQVDAGSGAIGAGLWNAVARGVDVKVVADAGHVEPNFPQQELVVRKALVDSGQVKSVPDIKGLAVGMSVRGTSVEYAIVKMLEKHGLSMTDINALEMPPTDFATAMINGKIDAAFAIQPSLTTLLTQEVATHLMYDWEAVPDNQSLALLYSPQFAASDLAVPFMQAYLRGIRVYDDAFQKHQPDAREKAFEAVVKYGPVKDRSIYENYTSFFLIDPDGKLRMNRLEEQQNFFLSTGVQTTRVDFTKIVDTHFAEEASAKLGPYGQA
jgi:NitT/TauT family transport system substrate-binding protein